MLSGRPIFPGKSTLDMLEKIAAVLGKPTEKQCVSLQSPFTATMMENVNYQKLDCNERTYEEQVGGAHVCCTAAKSYCSAARSMVAACPWKSST